SFIFTLLFPLSLPCILYFHSSSPSLATLHSLFSLFFSFSLYSLPHSPSFYFFNISQFQFFPFSVSVFISSEQRLPCYSIPKHVLDDSKIFTHRRTHTHTHTHTQTNTHTHTHTGEKNNNRQTKAERGFEDKAARTAHQMPLEEHPVPALRVKTRQSLNILCTL